ncbi:Sec-independent protein translocase TatB [Luteimicrobium sp. NPDC057192]|uniref:Sec-independent protein translocase TatB n=1 Tax=Luteimicrobium sp. NPDC057192 TaxID=3346042 RepID=UPI00362EAEBC
MFDINPGELVVIVVLAVVLIGPEKMPQYAAQLGRLARRVRGLALDTRERVAEQLGAEAADIEWSKLDPRQYDPRRIVREALIDDGPLVPTFRDVFGRAGAAAQDGPSAAPPPVAPPAAEVEPLAPEPRAAETTSAPRTAPQPVAADREAT